MKRLIAIICAIILGVSCIPHALALASADTNYKAVKIEGKYHAADILNALEKQTRSADSLTTTEKAILNDVLLPASMGITIPNIDVSKVIQTVDVYTLDSAFSEALAEHKVFRSHMTYSEFEELESTWLLPEDFINATKISYPELESVDLSSWTYGRYTEYIKQIDKERFIARFTDEELKALNKRGIRIEDLGTLLSSYHTIENVLAQSNEDLKERIEVEYTFVYEKLQTEVASSRSGEPDPSSSLYTYAVFPGFRHGNPAPFRNTIMTTAYWRGIQSARTLQMQQKLYGISSSLTTLHCTNLYGTYSPYKDYEDGVLKWFSAAHEGIDFTDPNGSRTPDIYAICSGERLRRDDCDHLLLIYDVNYPGENGRTHSYMHMDDIMPSVGSNIALDDKVGKQGDKGATEGSYHVHFEVNDGRDRYASLQTTDCLESESPYWVVYYLGCSGAHTYTWAHDSINHWRECTVTTCRYTTTPIAHSFSNGFCSICGRQDYNSAKSK